MRKTFVTNLALLIFVNLLIKPFWIFGIDRTVQNVVGAESYGFYFALFNLSFLFNIVLDAGITNFNNRNIAQHSQLLTKHFSNIVVLKFALALLYLFITIGFALVLGYSTIQIKMLLFLTFNQFLLSLILYLRSNLSALHLFRTDSLISVLDRSLMIAICSVLLWGNVTQQPFRIEWFVYTQTAAYLLTAFITFLFVFSKLDFLRLRFDWHFFLVILKYSYPFALLALLMGFYTRVDSVMLERMLPDGQRQAGIYAQSFRILDAASMFAYLFAGLLLPMFSKMIKKQEPVNQLVRLAFLLLIIPAITISISAFFFRTQIIDLLYHDHVKESADIFGVLILGFIAISTSYIFGTLLTANGNLKQLNLMAGGGMVANIVLNFILIPRFGAFGSAVASLFTQGLTAFVQVVIAKRLFNLQLRPKFALAMLFFIAGVTGLNFIAIEYATNWLLALLAVGILSLDFAFIIKLLNLKDLFKILKETGGEP